MIEQIFGWVVGIMMLFFIPYTIYFNIIQIYSRWKCRKKTYFKPFKSCHNSSCKFSKYCEDYEYVYSADEVAELHKMIDDLKN